MTSLVRYEQARFALAECQRVDEVKDIRDKAEAMAAYARQSKDTELVEWATEIKVRAERKCGEFLSAIERTPGNRTDRTSYQPVTKYQQALDDNELNHMAANRMQQLASMPEEHFETAVATAKDAAGQVTTAFMLREAKKSKPLGKAKKGPKADAIRNEIKDANERGVSMLCVYARLLFGAIRASESFTKEEDDLLNQIASAIDLTRSVLHED
jgi:DNA-binding transcriptional regulator YbjK